MRARSSRGDRGVVLVLFGLLLVFFLILVAFAVDLGQGRSSRRTDQQLVDLASLAAGRSLAGHDTPPGMPVQVNPYDACRAAINSVQTNAEGFAPPLSAGEIATACSVFHNPYGSAGVPACTATTSPQSLAPAIVRGAYTLDITYPVPDDAVKDARFSGNQMGIDDGGQCERMEVEVHHVNETQFAGVIGVDEIPTTARAIVRGGLDPTDLSVAALLLLEREGCGALVSSGQGKVLVKASGTDNPGRITADSAGKTPPCTTNNNANGWVIFAGNALPAGGPRIEVEDSSDGSEGVISTYAGSVGGRAGCCYPAGLSHDLTNATRPTSRRPADDRFNPPSPSPVRETISSLHSSGYTNSVTNGSVPLAGSVVTDCNPMLNVAVATATSVTVNCPTGFTASGMVTFPMATSVKFIGSVTVPNGATLHLPAASSVTIGRPSVSGEARLVNSGTGIASFPAAERVDIGGTPNTCTQVNNCSALSVSGTFQMNNGDISNTECTPQADDATLASFGGHHSITGTIVLCETAVYVGRSTAIYSPSQRVDGDASDCPSTLPCPVASEINTRDRFLLSGGGSNIEWTGPDQHDDPPNTASPFEGLALWVEGSGLSEIKGTGQLRTTGVFFLPNANFELGGQGSGANPRNAQFFARRLNFSGQGVLELMPSPKDAIPTYEAGDFGLIR